MYKKPIAQLKKNPFTVLKYESKYFIKFGSKEKNGLMYNWI